MAHHNHFPNRRRMIWKAKARRQLARFTEDSPHMAWRDAVYWGRYRHWYVWQVRTAEAMILSVVKADGWHIGAVWSVHQWQCFVRRHEQESLSVRRA